MLLDDGWIPRGSWCYKFYDEKTSWEEANQRCGEKVKLNNQNIELKGTDSNLSNSKDAVLATVFDQDVNNFVTSLAKGSQFWIGGRRSGDEWKWTQSTGTEFENWASGEPNNWGGDENCVQMGYPLFQNHKWNDQKCSVQIGFVCQTNNQIEGNIEISDQSTGLYF